MSNRTTLRMRLSMARYEWHKSSERVVMKLAWALPKQITYWAAIRVMAHATTGSFSKQIVPELLAMDALDRWSDQTGGDRRVGQKAQQ